MLRMAKHANDKVLTVALNPSVDKTQIVDNFNVGRIHRVERTLTVAGGKANNAARVLRALGHAVKATGFIAGPSGDWIAQNLAEADIEAVFLTIPGETRTSTAIIDEKRKTTTELRERGAPVPAEAKAEFLQRLPTLVGGCPIAVISGSLPPGVSPAYLANVIRQLKALNVVVVLDASGPALVEGLQAGPAFIKPNEDELAELGQHLGFEKDGAPQTVSEFIHIARTVATRYGVNVAASLGKHGAHLARPDGDNYTVPAPPVAAVNPVGAGDSFVAGLASGMLKGLDAKSTLRLAVACGTASVLRPEVAVVNPADVGKLLTRMETGTGEHAN